VINSRRSGFSGLSGFPVVPAFPIAQAFRSFQLSNRFRFQVVSFTADNKKFKKQKRTVKIRH
jgi:hypothetical protein